MQVRVSITELFKLSTELTFIGRGDRALSSCLGGGDLDGDDFNLILDVGFSHRHPTLPAEVITARIASSTG
jgi:RNA-dependent RNA polymerase